MDRRSFNKLVGLGAVGAFTRGPWTEAEAETPQEAMAQLPARSVAWPTRTYRRLLIDTHVPDWDSLLANFDPAAYVNTIAEAGFQSLLQYANSHVGLCLWRTQIGQMHRAMKGRDFFGEVMEQCKRHGLHRSAYYSVVYDDWAYQNHPDWRNLPEGGYDPQLFSRSGTVCINSPYREHALACLRELVGNYDFEGIFLDMTFWPTVCYCPHCTMRFWKEHDRELPRIVDWKDPDWRTFQRARERWMLEFTQDIYHTIKQTRPISVYQQFSPIFFPWQFGVSLEQNESSDFCGGDFYGGAAQFSLVCKAYWGLTRTKPFEFMTSRTLNLHDFETTKPYEQLLLESMIPTIHSSSYLLIDALKPDGTLNHRAYEYMSQVNAQHDPYEEFLGGELQADVAIYFDKESAYDPDVNGVTASAAYPPVFYGGPKNLGLNVQPGPTMTYPHVDAVVGTARILREAHIPFGVITNINLDQLSRYRAVVLPSVLEMTEAQANQFREFVRNGGVLYASGPSSLNSPDQNNRRFLLEDVLGVRYMGPVAESPAYLYPKDQEIHKTIWPQDNIGFSGAMVKAESLPGAEVLATVTLPFVKPDAGYSIGVHFAQIWSDPPASMPGEDPGIVVNSFGKGKTIWITAPVETRAASVDAALMIHLLRRSLPGPYKFEAEMSHVVEVTLFHQEDKHRLLVGLLNLQESVPTSPVSGTVRIQAPAGKHVRRVLQLPGQKQVPFQTDGPYIRVGIAPFKIVSMALVEYS